MLNLRIILIGAMATLTLLLACRGAPAPPPNETPTPPSIRPSPLEPPATRLQEPAESRSINATTAAVVRSAASAPNPLPTPTVAPVPHTPAQAPPTPATAAPAETPSATHPARDASDDVAEIRRIIAAYWEALNNYDVDHAITMLEPSYRAQEEELIRKDIGRMKLFRVKLELSEETPPAINDDRDYETYLSLRTPIDTRRVLMVFRLIEGRWWIVYSNEVE